MGDRERAPLHAPRKRKATLFSAEIRQCSLSRGAVRIGPLPPEIPRPALQAGTTISRFSWERLLMQDLTAPLYKNSERLLSPLRRQSGRVRQAAGRRLSTLTGEGWKAKRLCAALHQSFRARKRPLKTAAGDRVRSCREKGLPLLLRISAERFRLHTGEAGIVFRPSLIDSVFHTFSRHSMAFRKSRGTSLPSMHRRPDPFRAVGQFPQRLFPETPRRSRHPFSRRPVFRHAGRSCVCLPVSPFHCFFTVLSALSLFFPGGEDFTGPCRRHATPCAEAFSQDSAAFCLSFSTSPPGCRQFLPEPPSP